MNPFSGEDGCHLLNHAVALFRRPPFIPVCSYGVVLKASQRPTEALRVLLESVHGFPCNWSAWLDLATLVTDREQVRWFRAVTGAKEGPCI